MTFVSYAQNFEDVLLWRALGHVRAGFYVDVGAAHPDVDSVTRAFFERGWRGINIEPGPADAARLAAARPGDITLQLAAGRCDGEADFFTVPGTGLSTLDPAVAESYRARHWSPRPGRIAVRTLASLFRAHVRTDIHFLKIDVEGAEAEVLAGADLRTWRPWIILVEATAPLSTEPTYAAWEPGLLEQGYRFVWFDGLNRFYVADERADALATHFRTPPNVFDDFIRANDTVWAERIGTAETRAAIAEGRLAGDLPQATQAALAARARADAAAHEAARLQQDLAVLRQESFAREAALGADLHQSRHDLQQVHLRLQAALRTSDERAQALERVQDSLDETTYTLAQAHHQLHHTTLAMNEAQAWLTAIGQSTSWRLTGPIRVALRAVKGGRPRPAPQPAPSAPPLPPLPRKARTQPPAPPVPPPPNASNAVAAHAASLTLPEGFFDIRPLPPASPPTLGRRRTQVHQFHSGSAVADAITNAMLLTRAVLRGLGYVSEIFVTHRAPELADELRLLDELPPHDEYVLIVRHSMGHDSFERIAALPAPKILIYHNITPPDLLTRHPMLAAYAALGRQQLAALRGQVHAALADSEYNAVELRQLGFEPVRACTLLFDIDAMLARANAMPAQRGGAVFTILFVGRICQSKAQLELIGAYNAFRTLHHAPARLVLVGRDDAGDPYAAAARRAVAHSAQPHEIILTGLIDDDARDAWYASADLYVSLSRHEGFGVPLVEAMAHGVPVLARASGAIPYTLSQAGADAGALLAEDAGALEVGTRLHDLARAPERRFAQAAAQRASLARFALPPQAAILAQALLRAGAALPSNPQTRAALAANLHFAVTGHANTSYSLAAINRSLALTLEAACPGRVRLIPVEGVFTTDLSASPAAEAAPIAVLAGRAAPLTAPELIISQHYPVHVPPRVAGQIRLALVFWEESRLPAETIATLQDGFDGVVAPSRFVARALQDSGLRLPLRVIPPPDSLAAFRALAPMARDALAPLTFLHVSSCFPRKGADILLRAWAASFTAASSVRLLIKSFSNPHSTIRADIAALRAANPDLAPITLIEQDLDEAGMATLYAQSDVMVLPTRGEGYNLPAAEALAAGLRLIVTGAGGHMDFCTRDDPRIRLLAYRHTLSGSHLATPQSLWLEPDATDLGRALREACDRGHAIEAAQAGGDPGGPGTVAEAFVNFGLDLLLRPPNGGLRVAWVSSWGQRCGIAEYSRLLLGALEPESGLEIAALEIPGLEITVLCDDRTPAYDPVPGSLAHIPCWHVGDAPAPDLLAAIARVDADAVVLQHQPGLMGWERLAATVREIACQGRVVSVTLHNTRTLLDLAEAERASVLDGLSAADKVIVHTRADLDRLAGFDLGNAALFAHGVRAARPPSPPRKLAETDDVVIGCYGFFLPGKGIDTLAEAGVLLRETWPGAQLRLVNAAYGSAESEDEIARTRALAAPLGQAAQFHTGFLPQDQSLTLLAGCDLIVLPHRASKEAFSGALCTALAASVPTLVNDVHLFDEADDAVWRVDAANAANLAADIDRALRDLALRQRLQASAQAWIRERDWPSLAGRLFGMLTGLARSRPQPGPEE